MTHQLNVLLVAVVLLLLFNLQVMP